jgi:type IV pilus assembly protein PilV
MKRQHSPRSGMQGMAMLEALIAITIFSIALLGLVGLQAQSIKNNSQAKFRADASFIASQVLADISLDRANISNATLMTANELIWDANAARQLPGGRVTVTVAGSQITVDVFWTPNAEMSAATVAGYEHRHTLIANINPGDV